MYEMAVIHLGVDVHDGRNDQRDFRRFSCFAGEAHGNGLQRLAIKQYLPEPGLVHRDLHSMCHVTPCKAGSVPTRLNLAC